MVGAGALLSSVFRAPLTAALLLFELTRGYELVLPLLCAKGTKTYFAKDKTCMRTTAGTFPSAWNCKYPKNTPPTANLMKKPVCVSGPKPTLKPTQYPTSEPTNAPTLAEGGTPEG